MRQSNMISAPAGHSICTTSPVKPMDSRWESFWIAMPRFALVSRCDPRQNWVEPFSMERSTSGTHAVMQCAGSTPVPVPKRCSPSTCHAWSSVPGIAISSPLKRSVGLSSAPPRRRRHLSDGQAKPGSRFMPNSTSKRPLERCTPSAKPCSFPTPKPPSSYLSPSATNRSNFSIAAFLLFSTRSVSNTFLTTHTPSCWRARVTSASWSAAILEEQSKVEILEENHDRPLAAGRAATARGRELPALATSDLRTLIVWS
mmetsp:Transcript_52898/g.125896  ORF Transcript_52898/g.125896 Transcript_52898/m.125896 type:complete len:257 (+) Transcript_52898:356-1126(+)